MCGQRSSPTPTQPLPLASVAHTRAGDCPIPEAACLPPPVPSRLRGRDTRGLRRRVPSGTPLTPARLDAQADVLDLGDRAQGNAVTFTDEAAADRHPDRCPSERTYAGPTVPTQRRTSAVPSTTHRSAWPSLPPTAASCAPTSRSARSHDHLRSNPACGPPPRSTCAALVVVPPPEWSP